MPDRTLFWFKPWVPFLEPFSVLNSTDSTLDFFVSPQKTALVHEILYVLGKKCLTASRIIVQRNPTDK